MERKLLFRSGDEDEDEEPENCAAPLTCKEKDLLRYYYYIHNGIATKYVAGQSCHIFYALGLPRFRTFFKYGKSSIKIS